MLGLQVCDTVARVDAGRPTGSKGCSHQPWPCAAKREGERERGFHVASAYAACSALKSAYSSLKTQLRAPPSCKYSVPAGKATCSVMLSSLPE